MSFYRKRILRALADSGWEQVSVTTDGLEWWADEIWKLRSVRQNWGFEVWLTFVVDPMWEGTRRSGQGIRLVAVTARSPRDRQEAEAGVSLWMDKGLFDEKLGKFIADLDRARSTASLEKVEREEGA